MCGMSKVAKFAEKTLGALEVESTDTRSRTQIRMTIASTRNLCILGDSATHMDTPLNNNKHAVYRYVPAILSATRYKKKSNKIPQFPRSFFFGWICRVSRCQAKESAAFCNSLSCDPFSCSRAGKPGKMMNV